MPNHSTGPNKSSDASALRPARRPDDDNLGHHARAEHRLQQQQHLSGGNGVHRQQSARHSRQRRLHHPVLRGVVHGTPGSARGCTTATRCSRPSSCCTHRGRRRPSPVWWRCFFHAPRCPRHDHRSTGGGRRRTALCGSPRQWCRRPLWYLFILIFAKKNNNYRLINKY